MVVWISVSFLPNQTAHLMSFTWASHIAASVLTGRWTPTQSTNQWERLFMFWNLVMSVCHKFRISYRFIRSPVDFPSGIWCLRYLTHSGKKSDYFIFNFKNTYIWKSDSNTERSNLWTVAYIPWVELIDASALHDLFDITFCEFVVTFCEFDITFCEFGVTFCKFDITFCEFSVTFCEFESGETCWLAGNMDQTLSCKTYHVKNNIYIMYWNLTCIICYWPFSYHHQWSWYDVGIFPVLPFNVKRKVLTIFLIVFVFFIWNLLTEPGNMFWKKKNQCISKSM